MTNAGQRPGGAEVDIHPIDAGIAGEDADIAVVTDVHDQLLRACDRLESICDSLPHGFSRVDCLEMSRWLERSFPDLIQKEEQSLVRVPTPAGSGYNHATDAVWRHHHRTDVIYAAELAETLDDFARRDQPGEVDALAYMMRGFFEAARRHVAYVELLVAAGTGDGNG